ncbi:MAG: ATP-binding protein, partial [Hungatella sp.]|nr:ATP-binding protein [Hungatella sp.]
MRLYDTYFNRKIESRAYKQEEEYRQDWFAMLDMRLSVLFAYRLQKNGEREAMRMKASTVRGLVLPIEDRIAGLEEETLRWSEDKGNEEIRSEICRAEAHIMSRLASTPQRGGAFLTRKLVLAFELGRLEEFLLFLSMAVHYDAKYETLFGCLQGEDKSLPTLRLAFSLYELTNEISPVEKGCLLEQKGKLFEYLVTGDQKHSGPPGSRKFIVYGRVYAFMMERRFLAPELEAVVTAYKQETLPPVLIRQETVDRLGRLFGIYGGKKEGDCHILHIYGEKGNGRHFSVKHAAGRNGYNVLFIDVSRITDGKIQEIDLAVRILKRESILTHSILCFEDTGFRGEDEEGIRAQPFPPALDYLLKRLAREFPFFVWLTEEKAGYLTGYPLHFMALESPMLTVGERIVLWKELSGEYSLAEDIDFLLCANQYILTAGGIREVLARARMMCEGDGQEVIKQEVLLAAVKQQSVNQLGRYATLIPSVFTWGDLVIDEDQKRQMQMICDQVRYRNVVGEEWGFHKKSPYGRGICALFYGSPGTGKTMAAQVMANELGLDLYRIDLSQMVSKYIGETEKNISALFRKAKNINALLFFDEADSMFAKRSEVKDSNDRYANSETAHLLQKLEDYGGITILATNYANNIDDAFKRRIKFMINFVFPTEDVRCRLWTTIVPPQAAYEEEIDFEFFARNFELSGSNIKEILTSAAYLAAAKRRGLANGDIVEAVKLNFAKYGKILTSEDFGYLGQIK